jgi:hypothetical protein
MSDEQEKKPTDKFSKTGRGFGSIKEQYETIGGRKEDTDMQSTITSKRQDAITSKQQNVPEMKRQTVYMPTALADWLKAHAALIHDDISGIMTRLVEDYKDKVEGK